MTPPQSQPDDVEGSTDRVLWGAGTPRTVRPHWALLELGLEYRNEPILPRTAEMERGDFLSLSRRGKVPILDDGGRIVGESAAIVLYLADRYATEGVRLDVPVDGPDRGAYYDLSFFVLTELDATTLYVLRRHEGLPDVYGEAPVATAAAREYFLRQLGEIERRLEDGRAHLLGDLFTSPDLLLTTCLDWARFVGIALPGPIDAYRSRIVERPAYVQAMKANFAPLAALPR